MGYFVNSGGEPAKCVPNFTVISHLFFPSLHNIEEVEDKYLMGLLLRSSSVVLLVVDHRIASRTAEMTQIEWLSLLWTHCQAPECI